MESPPPTATISKAVKALLKWKETQSETHKAQLLPQDEFIYLNLTLKKIPPTPRTNPHRIPLPHPLHPPSSSDLCLIIDDRPTSNLTLHTAHKIINSQNITIIELSTLRTDYVPFEAKRKLLHSYDLFLVDRRIVHLLPKLLGKHFFKKKKLPLALDLTHKNWKEQVERACGSALVYLSTGTCSVVRVGRCSMGSEEIVENVAEAIKGVVSVVPKKWGGVRSLHLRLKGSVALPLYQALPDIKLRIEGFKESKQAEVRGEARLVEGSGKEEAVEGSGKKKRKDRGRIHEVRYMDFDTSADELGIDDDDDDDDVDANVEEREDVEDEEIQKVKKKPKKLKNAKKNKPALEDGKKKKASEVGKKLKKGSLKPKSKKVKA